jgi:phospholipase/carboxylesterase
MLPDLGFVYRYDQAEIKTGKGLLLLHGTGGTENDLIDLGRLIAPDFNLLSPRGKVSENGMNRFFRRKSVGVFDVEDLKHRAIQLSDFIRKAKKEFELHQLIAVGYSNGANIASGLVLQDPGLLSGAILLRPMVPYEPEALDLQRIKILMISGVMDNTMSEDEPERLLSILTTNNAQVTSHVLSASHGLATDDLRISKEWLKINF